MVRAERDKGGRRFIPATPKNLAKSIPGGTIFSKKRFPECEIFSILSLSSNKATASKVAPHRGFQVPIGLTSRGERQSPTVSWFQAANGPHIPRGAAKKSHHIAVSRCQWASHPGECGKVALHRGFLFANGPLIPGNAAKSHRIAAFACRWASHPGECGKVPPHRGFWAGSTPGRRPKTPEQRPGVPMGLGSG